MIDCCGYPPTNAARSLAKRYAELGRLPSGLFVNGVTALEGALRFTSTLRAEDLGSVVVGAFDWDPFAAHLPFDVTMVRQNVEAMIAEEFTLLDNYSMEAYPIVVVPTTLEKPASRTASRKIGMRYRGIALPTALSGTGPTGPDRENALLNLFSGLTALAFGFSISRLV